MNREMLISVVIPAYNAETTLRAAVESAAAQTYSPLEIVIVDDGSSDGTLALARELAAKDDRIRVVHQANGGLSNARNRGTREAAGALVGYLDSDDLIYPDMYEKLYEGYCTAIRRWPDGRFFVQTGREEITEEGEKLESVCAVPSEPVFLTAEEFMRTLLTHQGDSSFCTRLCSRQLMLEHPFESGVLSEDFSLQMHLTDVLSGMLLIPYTGYRVTHRAGSMTRRASDEEFPPVYTAILEHADYVERELVPRHPALRGAARRFGLYMRMEYLLHVPVGAMDRTNTVYCETVSYLRRHFADILKVPYLTRRNRLYLTGLALCPRFLRRAHRRLKGAGL